MRLLCCPAGGTGIKQYGTNSLCACTAGRLKFWRRVGCLCICISCCPPFAALSRRSPIPPGASRYSNAKGTYFRSQRRGADETPAAFHAAPLRVKRRTACAGLRCERCSLQRGGSKAYGQPRQAYLQCVTWRVFYVDIAQLVELLPDKQEVAGSFPAVDTKTRTPPGGRVSNVDTKK